MLGLADRLPGVVEALRKEGLARVLAKPTLVTVSGKPAYFRVGGEIPLRSEGLNGVPVQRWEQFGTKATFLPQVLDNGRLRVELLFEYSEVDRAKTEIVAGKENPVIRRWSIDTGWEAKPGQTIALAARSDAASADAKDSRRPAMLMLVTPQIVDSMAALPSPDKAKPRGVDAVR
jgi:Flp pilus assembly secretin CpaC